MPELKRFEVGYLSTNCYVITQKTVDEAIIIDAGGGFERIKAYLDGQGKRPIAVLCTHGHFDHVLDARKWQDLGAKIYIHKEDESFLTGKQTLMPGREFAINEAFPDVILSGGEKFFVAGLEFEVVYTPGHSKGSVCFRFPDVGIFVGDTIFYHSYGRTDFIGGSFSEITDSVNKILSINGDARLFTGHGEETTISEERLFNPLRY